MKNKKTFHVLLCSILIVSMAYSKSSALIVKRIQGKDRYETCVRANQDVYTQAKKGIGIISSGVSFRESIYASYLASTLEIPYYITPQNKLTDSIKKEISRLGIKKFYIVGDYGVISKSVESKINSLGVKTERITKDSKYSLPGKIDVILEQNLEGGIDKNEPLRLILINDRSFPDLISSVPLISRLAREQHTLLMPYYNYDEYDPNVNGITKYIIGGENTIPIGYDSMSEEEDDGLSLIGRLENGKKDLAGRLYGKDRYDTSGMVGTAFSHEFGWKTDHDVDTVIIVNGEDFPDAISSGIVGNKYKASVLLTKKNEIPIATWANIDYFKIKNIIIVGGENSVSKEVEKTFRESNSFFDTLK